MNDIFTIYRRQIVLTIIICLAAIAILVGVKYLSLFQDITITYVSTDSAHAVLYEGTQTGSSDPDNVQATATKIADPVISGKKYHIKKGNYYLKITGTNIEPVEKGIILADSAQNISYDSYNYSVAHLQELLTPDLQRTIQNVIIAKYPTIPNLYTFQNGALYKHGDWYGANLIWAGDPESLSRDTLKIITHKEGGAWKVATEPNILLSSKDYPSVPKDVLDAINTDDANTPSMPNFTIY